MTYTKQNKDNKESNTKRPVHEKVPSRTDCICSIHEDVADIPHLVDYSDESDDDSSHSELYDVYKGHYQLTQNDSIPQLYCGIDSIEPGGELHDEASVEPGGEASTVSSGDPVSSRDQSSVALNGLNGGI